VTYSNPLAKPTDSSVKPRVPIPPAALKIFPYEDVAHSVSIPRLPLVAEIPKLIKPLKERKNKVTIFNTTS
jgi:hypothetical protein